MQFQIAVISDDPEEESTAIKRITASLIRHGVKDVVMIVDGEQTHYEDGGTHVSTLSLAELFGNEPPTLPPLAVIVAAKRKKN